MGLSGSAGGRAPSDWTNLPSGSLAVSRGFGDRVGPGEKGVGVLSSRPLRGFRHWLSTLDLRGVDAGIGFMPLPSWKFCLHVGRKRAPLCPGSGRGLPAAGRGRAERERGESDRPCRKLEVLLYSQRFPREEGAVVFPSKCALGGIVRRWKIPPREKSPGPAALGTSPLFRKLCGFKDETT